MFHVSNKYNDYCSSVYEVGTGLRVRIWLVW